MFDQKLGETELMICEEEGLTKERFRMTAVVSALADKKTFREEMYQRAERFERNYKKRIRRGFCTRMRLARKIVVGYWETEAVQNKSQLGCVLQLA